MTSNYNDRTMKKIQLTLTRQEADILSAKAAQLGYNLTRFIKFLISKEAVEAIDLWENLPTFPMSAKREKQVEKVLKEHAEGKTHELKDLKDLFE